MKKYVGYIVGGMMAFSMLSGCGNTSGAIQNESDVYMSQFGEYENGGAQSAKGLSECDADNAGGALTSSNGEKIYEETEFDGKPVEPAADIDKAEDEKEQETKKETDKKITKKAKKPAKAAEVNVIAVPEPLMPAVAAEVTQIAPATPDGNQSTDQSLMAQTIGNPTENNSSSGSSSGSSDTGSGVSQTCDDDGGTDTDDSSSSSVVAFFE